MTQYSNNMSKNVIKLNESQIQAIVAKSVKRLLQEGFGDDFFNDLNNMVDNPNDYFAADRERDDEEFNRCMDEVSEFTEALSKSYRPEIIIRALQQEVESFEECQSSGEIDEESERWMSDNDIAEQYKSMEISGFKMEHLKNSEGWKGYFDLDFPNADGIDYAENILNQFIVYDDNGDRIAWDEWLPDEQTQYLESIIRQEIQKRGSQI